jgi:ABC-type branched-subunit amino acid transport system substrate-binding protein
MKVIAALTITLVAGASLVACSGQTSTTTTSGSSNQTFTIGAALPLSGPNISFGKLLSDGYDSAVKYVNSAGIIKGKLKMAYGDDQCLPQPAVTAVHQLVEVNNAVALGVLCSNAVQAVAPYTLSNKILTVNTNGSSPDMAGVSKSVVSLGPLLTGELPLMMNYAVKKLKVKKVAVMYTDETLGQSAAKAVNSLASKLHYKVVASLNVSALDTTDFSSQVAKIAAAKPDAVFVGMLGASQSNAFLTNLRQAGVTAPALSYDGFNDPTTIALDAAQGSYYAQPNVDLSATDKVTKGYLASYRKTHSADPAAASLPGANAVILIAEAIAALQKSGTKVTSAAILNYVNSDKKFDLIGGNATFIFPDAILAPAMSIIKIENKAPVSVQSITSATVRKTISNSGL